MTMVVDVSGGFPSSLQHDDRGGEAEGETKLEDKRWLELLCAALVEKL